MPNPATSLPAVRAAGPHCPKYDPKIGAKVCELIADGYTLKQIGELDGMPHKRDILAWRATVPEFTDLYARAKLLQMDHFAEEIQAIADDGSNDWMDRELASGAIVEVPNHEHIKRSELRVNTRKWIMAKLAPRKYGEKMLLADADGGSLIERFRKMNAEQREETLMALAVKAGLVIEHRPAEEESESDADSGESQE